MKWKHISWRTESELESDVFICFERVILLIDKDGKNINMVSLIVVMIFYRVCFSGNGPILPG